MVQESLDLGTMRPILLANTPQLLISIAYFSYNGLLTSMLSAAEYSSYGVERKPLRVTNPIGLQRSTYWLSVPFRYSIPLLIAFAILHWLVSQSIFYVFVIGPKTIDGDPTSLASTCGYSPIAIIFAIGVGTLMVLTLPALGLRRFKSKMPVAGSSSLVISAACHPPRADRGAACERVMWGKIISDDAPQREVGFGDDVRCEHFSFTSQNVLQP